MDFKLYESKLKTKKYTAEFNKKKIHFGASGYSDYTIHKDDDRKKRYIERHSKREDWDNIQTAGALSRWILWNKKTLDQSIIDTEKRFGIRIENRT